MEFSATSSIVDENAMDIESSDHRLHRSDSNRAPIVPVIGDGYDVVVVSSVGLHVEGPIPFINPEIPVEQHAIVQIESNDVDSNSDETERISPVPSVVSSRATSPIYLPEESNQSVGTNSDYEKENKKRCLSEDEDDGRLCPICLDNWTNTGEHRICALKCGHLFGYKCVLRWLDSQKFCPTCKKRVNRSDLRYIYAKKVIAVDTTELDVMKQLLDSAAEEKNRMLMDISKYMCREHMLQQEIVTLKGQIQELSSNRPGGAAIQPSSSSSTNFNDINTVRLYMDKNLEICRQSGCRVFDAHCPSDQIIVSMKSPNNLWAGYGLRKVNISQYKPLSFMPLHTQQIRDICFHPAKNWVLTVSMDKSLKVVDTNSNFTCYATSQQMPLWSCCWDADNQYILYIGTQSGAVVKYDVRNITNSVCTLAVPGDMSPVVSIASIPSCPGGDLPNGGVISCKLNSLWAFENSGNFHVRHPLPLEGPFVSMKYQPKTKQLLISSRPNNRIAFSRHTLCTLEKINGDKINCNVIHCFQGGGMQKLLSKSCFLSDKQEYVAAHQESSKSVYLWSINTGQRVCAIPAHDAVLDLQGIQTHTGNFLVSLTERKLEFFKFY